MKCMCMVLGCLVAGIPSHSGDHHAHSTRSGKQSEIVWSSHPRVLHCEVHVYGEVMRRWGEGLIDVAFITLRNNLVALLETLYT